MIWSEGIGTSTLLGPCHGRELIRTIESKGKLCTDTTSDWLN